MSAADALIFPSHPPAGSLATPGDGAGDDGDDPSPHKPSHTVEDADPIFPEEDEEEEEDDDGDGENHSPQPPQPCPGTTRNRLQPQAVPEGRPEFCSVCNKMFRSIKALHGHMRSHPLRNWRGTVPRQVKGAENEVADYLLLLSGQEQEQRKRRFICSSCNREFPTRQALGGHRASHKGQKGCYEKAKEAREYGPRLGRKRAPLNEMETAGAAPSEAKQTELVVVQYFASSSQPQVTTPSPPAPSAPAPAAALSTTPPPAPAAAAVASAATKRPAKGSPRVATRRRRLLDLNMAPVSEEEEDNSGGNGDGSSTSSGKIEDSKMDSSYEASKP